MQVMQISRRNVGLTCSGKSRHCTRTPVQYASFAPAAAVKSSSESADSSQLLTLLWASGALASVPSAAWADEPAAAAAAAVEAAASPVEAAAEGAQQAAAAVSEAAAEATAGPTWLSYVVVLSPIIFYAIFNVYRSQVNPRIKFSDFLFIVAGIAVVANLVSIIGFKVRLF